MEFSMTKKKLLLASLVSSVIALSGCLGTMHGGGVVDFFDVTTGEGAGVATSANIAVSGNCNSAKQTFSSVLHIMDSANNVNFTARLRATPVNAIFESGTTCENLQDTVNAIGGSISFGLITSRGQEVGSVVVGVTKPGEISECGGVAQGVVVEAVSNDNTLPGNHYQAAGCLNKGKITISN
jgi:hypothetical protein